MKIKNFIALFLILLVVWILANNTLNLEIISIGLVLSLVLSLLFGLNLSLFNELKFTPAALGYTGIYLVVFFMELIKSNLDVARRVLTPSLPINPGIVKTKTILKSKMGRMILANSITLTPGTLSVDIQGDTLYIHWIDVCCDDIDKATQAIVKKFEKHLVKIYG
ncbi:MAG: Na+/H+ antiporter subunit E [Bacteroidales bacterium]|jgi:multicomponent Na+:H+ antiporter subunit E|nr:Na+/H+ antiporter subunit E [Bacteroidales bacterium]